MTKNTWLQLWLSSPNQPLFITKAPQSILNIRFRIYCSGKRSKKPKGAAAATITFGEFLNPAGHPRLGLA